MKATIFFLTLAASLAFVGPMHAKSLLSEVKPAHTEAAGFTVDITHERLADGTVKFRVTITEKGVKFSSNPSTALSTVKVTDHSSSITGSQPLPSKRQGPSMVCVFTVAKASLDDPDFCFVFTNQVERVVDGKLISMPSVDLVYARLKDFAQ
jgi:hypothetical protein